MSTCDTKYCGCLYYAANALARIMTKVAEDEFSITGLAPSYALLLKGVNDQPGITAMEISKLMQLTPSTVTRLVEKLESKGLAVRKQAGRFTEIYPTKESIELQPIIKKAWGNLYKKYIEVLGEDVSRELTTQVYDAYRKLNK